MLSKFISAVALSMAIGVTLLPRTPGQATTHSNP